MNLHDIKLHIEQKLVEQSIQQSEYINSMINRYIKFISICHINNNGNNDICERHHILPRSLYPQYISLIDHPWNLSRLTLRQHIIAHIMLHHIFGGKMSFALNRMVSPTNTGLYNRLYEASRKKYLLSDECKINAKKGNKTMANRLKSGLRIYYNNEGETQGLMLKDDPRIIEQNLTKDRRSVSHVKQRAERSRLASIANTDTTVYNNGTIQKKYKSGDSIPAGFVKGGLPRKLVKGHEVKYDFTTKDNQDYIIKLLKEYNGSLEKIGEIIGMAGVNVKYNINKHMNGINHKDYHTRMHKYNFDKAYKAEIDIRYPNEFDKIKFLDPEEHDRVITMRNTILNSDIDLTINGWIGNVVKLLDSNRKFVVSFVKTYMSDIDIFWRKTT